MFTGMFIQITLSALFLLYEYLETMFQQNTFALKQDMKQSYGKHSTILKFASNFKIAETGNTYVDFLNNNECKTSFITYFFSLCRNDYIFLT